MPKKTQMSRFTIHDELTAPEGSLPVLKGALASAGQLPNFLGVLAGSPAALRGYTRCRGELRHGTLTPPTLERIALAVAEHYRSSPGLAIHNRTARQAGLGIDEVARAREWESSDPREAALLRFLKPLVTERGKRPAAPPRGGARGRLDRRAAAGSHRGAQPGMLHGDGERRRRGSRGRLGGGDARASRRVIR